MNFGFGFHTCFVSTVDLICGFYHGRATESQLPPYDQPVSPDERKLLIHHSACPHNHISKMVRVTASSSTGDYTRSLIILRFILSRLIQELFFPWNGWQFEAEDLGPGERFYAWPEKKMQITTWHQKYHTVRVFNAVQGRFDWKQFQEAKTWIWISRINKYVQHTLMFPK